MNPRHARFLARAEVELARAVAYYDERVEGLGDAFLEEVQRVTRLATGTPELGAPHLFGTRRMLLRRFPYQIVYRVTENEIVVTAVAHQRRRPGYWRKRK